MESKLEIWLSSIFLHSNRINGSYHEKGPNRSIEWQILGSEFHKYLKMSDELRVESKPFGRFGLY